MFVYVYVFYFVRVLAVLVSHFFVCVVPGVSEKSDEFITCIFRVVLGIERRMGYQVKACSKIFCFSGNPPLGVTVLGSARAFS